MTETVDEREPLSRDNIGDRIRARVAAKEPVEPEQPTTDLNERARAISDWLLAATVHAPDGTVLVADFALLGNKERSDEFAEAIEAQLDAGLDENALTEWMLDYNRGGGAVRVFQLAPLITADLMKVLRDLGHV